MEKMMGSNRYASRIIDRERIIEENRHASDLGVETVQGESTRSDAEIAIPFHQQTSRVTIVRKRTR